MRLEDKDWEIKKRDVWGQKDSRREQEVTRMRWMRGRLLCSTASTLMISAARLLFIFFCFVFTSIQSVPLCLPHKQQSHIPDDYRAGEPWGWTHLPTIPCPPPSLVEIECARACGDSGCVFNASLRGGMGMRPVSGSGHIQYRGITPGSSEEMRTHSLPLPHPRLRVCVMDKTNRTSKTACLAAVFAHLS